MSSPCSSRNSVFSSTPSTSPARAMSVMSSASSSRSSISSQSSRSSDSHSRAFSSSIGRHEKASAYLSDDDLFGLDGAPYMREPPEPPRSASQWLAQPLLPPVTSSVTRTRSLDIPCSKRAARSSSRTS
ncbi:hypothetical protein K431DRAFT_35038 [Polychaeton citri CBS 116435]|uniref:Uncharacterized protein n=1 Tax=Polychaeton citri CBS 116435 TaxID=1314669 RepID=A0A9P4Q020_9PEZI|nr:hypothetical protein K431DRAFT_35038 [Polychaeton citri CBS 116435]